MPSIGNFNEESGQAPNKYLLRFESYCDSNFRGDRDTWLDELDRHLEGKTRDAFRALRDVDDSYSDMKQKLCEWYDDMREVRSEKCKINFSEARYQRGESMYLFCGRLERLFRLAYPKKKVQTSKRLIEKCVHAAPKDFRTMLKAHIMSQKIRNGEGTWKSVQKCASLFDVETEKEKRQKNDSGEVEDNIVNVHRPLKKRDVSIQHCSSEANLVPGKPFVRKPRVHAETSAPSQNSVRFHLGPVAGDAACRHCGRRGHFMSNCRKRLNQCFACGSEHHFMNQCPNYRRNDDVNNRSQQSALQFLHQRSAHEQRDRNGFASSRLPTLNGPAPAQMR